MPEFDKNAGYIWTIVAIGVVVPLLMLAYSMIKVSLAKRRLERLEADEAGE